MIAALRGLIVSMSMLLPAQGSAGGIQNEPIDPTIILATSGPLDGSVRFRIVGRLAESYFQIAVDKIGYSDEDESPRVLAHVQVPAVRLAREPGERVTDFAPREWKSSRALSVRINERETSLLIAESGGSIVVSLAE